MDKNFVKRIVAVSASLCVTLMPIIAFAQQQKEKAEEKTGFGFFTPVVSMGKTAFGWIKPFITLDLEWKYWWIILITVPLTIAWMWLASVETRAKISSAGVHLVFGLLALAVLLAFVAPFLGAVAAIIGVVSGLLGLSLGLSIRGIFNTIKTLLKMIPFFLVVWLITKIPGLQGLIERWVNLGQSLAGKVWAIRDKFKDKPSLFWIAIGGAVITLLINGKFAVHITEKSLLPGLIPGASAAVGLYFLVWRTALGHKLTLTTASRLTHQPMPGGGGPCPNYGRLPLCDVNAYKKKGLKIIIYEDPQTKKKPKFKKIGSCGGHIAPGGCCGGDQCDHRDPWRPWDCPSGDSKGLPWDTLKCPKCGAQKPMDPWCCVECGHWPKDKGVEGIPWSTPNCPNPKCKAPRPKWPTSPLHYVWDDKHQSAPESGVRPTAPAADHITCPAQLEVRDPATGLSMGKLDASGQFYERYPIGHPLAGEIIPETKVCGTVYPKSVAACPGCGSPNPTIARPAPPPPVPELTDENLPEALVVKCPHCRTVHNARAGYKYCPHCLQDMKAAPAPAAKTPAKKVKITPATLDKMWDLK